MSDTQELIFTLKDRSGGSHTYIVSPHIGSQGLKVVDAMLAIGMGPAAEAMFSAARASEARRSLSANGEVNLQFTDLIEHVDMEHVITSAQAGIQSAGGMEILAPLVLQHTTRDGLPLIQMTGNKRNTANFDLAYTRNWGELRSAFLKAMEINGFFELLAGWFVDDE